MPAAFLIASLVLAVTPGPGVLYIVGRTLAQGRAAGVASALGVACGNAANAVGAAIGLAALFAVSAVAFTVVTWAGAAYLVWLGVRLLRSASVSSAGTARLAVVPLRRLFSDGVLVAVLNPKTALFFAAFLPQFMQVAEPALPQALGLGALFVAIATVTDLGYVVFAGVLARVFAAQLSAVGTASRWGSRAGGVALIGLGLATVFGSRPAVR